jgi:ribosome recycling factor
MSEKKDVGYVYQFAATVADGMSVTFNGNFPVGVTTEEINAEIDRFRVVTERQRAKNEVKMLEAMLIEKEATIRNAEMDLRQYLKKNKDGDDFSERLKAKIEELHRDYERGTKQLEETKAKAV